MTSQRSTDAASYLSAAALLERTKARTKDLLSCPLCAQTLRDARALPCTHAFCARCLQRLCDELQAASKSRLGSFACPTCRVLIGLPRAGVQGFPSDSRVERIRDEAVEEMMRSIAAQRQAATRETPGAATTEEEDSPGADCDFDDDVREGGARSLYRPRMNHAHLGVRSGDFPHTTSNPNLERAGGLGRHRPGYSSMREPRGADRATLRPSRSFNVGRNAPPAAGGTQGEAGGGLYGSDEHLEFVSPIIGRNRASGYSSLRVTRRHAEMEERASIRNAHMFERPGKKARPPAGQQHHREEGAFGCNTNERSDEEESANTNDAVGESVSFFSPSKSGYSSLRERSRRFDVDKERRAATSILNPKIFKNSAAADDVRDMDEVGSSSEGVAKGRPQRAADPTCTSHLDIILSANDPEEEESSRPDKLVGGATQCHAPSVDRNAETIGTPVDGSTFLSGLEGHRGSLRDDDSEQKSSDVIDASQRAASQYQKSTNGNQTKYSQPNTGSSRVPVSNNSSALYSHDDVTQTASPQRPSHVTACQAGPSFSPKHENGQNFKISASNGAPAQEFSTNVADDRDDARSNVKHGNGGGKSIYEIINDLFQLDDDDVMICDDGEIFNLVEEKSSTSAPGVSPGHTGIGVTSLPATSHPQDELPSGYTHRTVNTKLVENQSIPSPPLNKYSRRTQAPPPPRIHLTLSTPTAPCETTPEEPSRGVTEDAVDGVDGVGGLLNEGTAVLQETSSGVYIMPTAVAMLASGGTVVADYGVGSLQYNYADGSLCHKIDTIKPFSVVVNPANNHVIVGDRKSRTVCVFDDYGGDVAQWDSNLFKWICGIGVLRNGNLAILDRARATIGVYSAGGELIREFGSYGVGDAQLCMGEFIAVDGHDRIITCDSGNHCIKVFSPEGKAVGKYGGGRGAGGDGELQWPKGVCVDARDNIIVADTCNGRVSMFSREGGFVQQLVTNVHSPYAVCYRQPDVVAVTLYSVNGPSQYHLYSLSA